MIDYHLRTPSLSPDLISDYERDAKILMNFSQENSSDNIDALDVLRSHYVVVDFCLSENIGDGVGGIGPRSYELLVSAVDRQHVAFGGEVKWVTPQEKVATLVYGIVKNHAFYDANKRSALLVLLYAFYKLNYYVESDKSELEDVLVYVAEDSLHLVDGFEDFVHMEDASVRFLAEYFRKNTRHIDKKQYIITYREMDRRLKGYGFHIANTDRNYADILTNDGGRRICKIGFPGWSRQVSKGDMRRILDACGLTSENGIDSQVFFFDADPVFAFASEYRAQIASLAYR